MQQLPRKSISPTRTAIDWLRIQRKDNTPPMKFDTKADALNCPIVLDSSSKIQIDRVVFRFDVAWLIFTPDWGSYLGKDLKFHECSTPVEERDSQ